MITFLKASKFFFSFWLKHAAICFVLNKIVLAVLNLESNFAFVHTNTEQTHLIWLSVIWIYDVRVSISPFLFPSFPPSEFVYRQTFKTNAVNNMDNSMNKQKYFTWTVSLIVHQYLTKENKNTSHKKRKKIKWQTNLLWYLIRIKPITFCYCS